MNPLDELLRPYRDAVAGREMSETDPVYSMLLDASSPTSSSSSPSLQGGGDLWAKLRKGFLEAGRPDLARMVGTEDFHTWVGAEGLSIPKDWSQSYPGHGKNYGVFQLWEGHPWLQGNESLAEQAYLAATQFTLNPDRIHDFADQIRAGSYEGWG